MKRVILVLVVVLFSTSVAFAGSYKERTGFGYNEPIGTIICGDVIQGFQRYDVEMGIGFIYEGGEEIRFPFHGYSHHMGLREFETGFLYHYYLNKEFSGAFAGGGFRLGVAANEDSYTKANEYTSLYVSPELSVGYRLNWKFLTVAARFELGYRLSDNLRLIEPVKMFYIETGILIR